MHHGSLYIKSSFYLRISPASCLQIKAGEGLSVSECQSMMLRPPRRPGTCRMCLTTQASTWPGLRVWSECDSVSIVSHSSPAPLHPSPDPPLSRGNNNIPGNINMQTVRATARRWNPEREASSGAKWSGLEWKVSPGSPIITRRLRARERERGRWENNPAPGHVRTWGASWEPGMFRGCWSPSQNV